MTNSWIPYANAPILPTNSTLIPSCVVFFPSRTRIVTCKGQENHVGDITSKTRAASTHLADHRISVIIHGTRNVLLLLRLDFDLLSLLFYFEFDIYVDWRRKEVGHCVLDGVSEAS